MNVMLITRANKDSNNPKKQLSLSYILKILAWAYYIIPENYIYKHSHHHLIITLPLQHPYLPTKLPL